MRIFTTISFILTIPYLIFTNETGMSLENRLLLSSVMAFIVFLMWKGTLEENKEKKDQLNIEIVRKKETENYLLNLTQNNILCGYFEYSNELGVILSVYSFESAVTDKIKHMIIDFISKLSYEDKKGFVKYSYEITKNSFNRTYFYRRTIPSNTSNVYSNEKLANLFNNLVDLLKKESFSISDSKIEIECLAVYIKAKIIEIETNKLIKKYKDISEKYKNELSKVEKYSYADWFSYYFSNNNNYFISSYYYYYFNGIFDKKIYTYGILCIREPLYLTTQEAIQLPEAYTMASQPRTYTGEKFGYASSGIYLMIYGLYGEV